MLMAFFACLLCDPFIDDEYPPPEEPIAVVGLSKEEIFIAKGLIASNPFNPQVFYTPRMIAAAREAAIELEILDKRELYYFNKEETFGLDLEIIARRYIEFRDAPKVAEIYKLPDYGSLRDGIDFNRLFVKHLKVRMQLETDRTEGFEEVLSEAEYLYKVYDAMRDARSDYMYVTCKREALQKLICLIGEEDYEKGVYPPSVPLWRFYERP